jgi:hypothetical protein
VVHGLKMLEPSNGIFAFTEAPRNPYSKVYDARARSHGTSPNSNAEEHLRVAVGGDALARELELSSYLMEVVGAACPGHWQLKNPGYFDPPGRWSTALRSGVGGGKGREVMAIAGTFRVHGGCFSVFEGATLRAVACGRRNVPTAAHAPGSETPCARRSGR